MTETEKYKLGFSVKEKNKNPEAQSQPNDITQPVNKLCQICGPVKNLQTLLCLHHPQNSPKLAVSQMQATSYLHQVPVVAEL